MPRVIFYGARGRPNVRTVTIGETTMRAGSSYELAQEVLDAYEKHYIFEPHDGSPIGDGSGVDTNDAFGFAPPPTTNTTQEAD